MITIPRLPEGRVRQVTPAYPCPTTPAAVAIRTVADLQFGDRVLYIRPRWPMEILTVLRAAPSAPRYTLVHHLTPNFKWHIELPSAAKFVVLTFGACTHPHQGYAMMCTPAPMRHDARLWPGDSTICPMHLEQMKIAHETLKTAI